MHEITDDGRARRHARWRRGLAGSTVVVAAVHALLLAFLVLPDPADRTPGEPRLTVLPMAPTSERPPRREIPRPEIEAEGDRPVGAERRTESLAPRPDRRSAIPIVIETPGAPEETTIPSTALDAELRARTLPLEAGPTGIRRRAPDEATLARMRAESLVDARLADLPGAKRKDRGAIGPAEGGGVRIAIPWPGFLPDDRRDETWREERCEGEDGGDNDKAGEAEARDSQCG